MKSSFPFLHRSAGTDLAAAGYGTAICFADEQRLEQILSILLDNAHSYAPESSVQLRVDQCEEGKTRFWVVDHGPGIPDEEKQAVFHYFYRRRRSNSRHQTKPGIMAWGCL